MSDIEDLEPERIPPGAAPGTAAPSPPAPAAAPPLRHRRAALFVAIAADVVQWVLWPLFMAGAVSPVDDVLDLGIAAVMIRLLGWHWAFLPAFVAKVLPGIDMVPSWTLAVWLATREQKRP